MGLCPAASYSSATVTSLGMIDLSWGSYSDYPQDDPTSEYKPWSTWHALYFEELRYECFCLDSFSVFIFPPNIACHEQHQVAIWPRPRELVRTCT